MFPCSSGILFHHHAPNSSGTEWGSHFFQQSLFTFVPSGFSGSLWFPLVPARDPGFVSRLFFLLPAKGFCSILIFWLCLRKFRGLSPYFSFFCPERDSVPSGFPVSSWFRLGFRRLSPFFFFVLVKRKGFCFILICWFLLVRVWVQALAYLLL